VTDGAAIPVIQTRGLSHRFGRSWALRDVDLEVPEGSLYALLGTNGAGKTTLLKILTGLLRPTSGEALLRNRRADRLTTADRARIGYVAEGQELPSWMTLAQLEAYLAPLYSTWDAHLAEELRDRFRLPARRKIRKLSRGEQMKVALLTSLAPRPEILIMDEPFTGMDALVKDELVFGLLELAQDEEWTVLLCSHDVGELETLADHVGFLDRGRLILSEPLDVLTERFRKVDVGLRTGSLVDMSTLPPTWLSPERAGDRVIFVSSEHGVGGWEDEVRSSLPGASTVEVSRASLRDIFIALAAEGLGGRDWATGGLGAACGTVGVR
jgi:ABC-2 type transport system ATP-binding protein